MNDAEMQARKRRSDLEVKLSKMYLEIRSEVERARDPDIADRLQFLADHLMHIREVVYSNDTKARRHA